MGELGSEQVKLCPKCGAASVDFSPLVGGGATCRACKWAGGAEALLAFDVHNVHGTREGSMMAFSNEYRKLFSQNAGFMRDLIGFLVKWGFVTTVEKDGAVHIDTAQATRYMAAVARGGMKAVIEERETIERESHG